LAFDANSLQLKAEKTLFTTKTESGKQLNAFGVFEDSLIVIYSKFENDKHVIEVNKVAGNLKGNKQYLDKLAIEKRYFDKITIAKSTNENKYLIQRHFQKEKQEVLSFKVLNHQLKEEAAVAELAFPAKANFYASLISNTGEVFIIFKSQHLAAKKEKGFNGFIIYKFIGGQKSTYIYQAPNHQLKETFFAINPSTNALAGASFATKPNKSEPAIFASFVKLDADTVTLTVTDLTSIYKNKKKISLQHHVINELIFRNDNGFVIIAESKKVETSIKNQFSNESFDDAGIQQIVYGNIFVASLNKQGVIGWHHFIPKNQVLNSRGSNYGSFNIINNGLKLKFLYNESIKNNAAFVNYELDAASNSERNLLFNIDQKDVFPIMENSKQISSNSLLFGSSRNDAFRLCKIYLEN